eukprot:6183533-Amphidinium_carterae.1
MTLEKSLQHSLFRVSVAPLGALRPVCRACTALTTPLQSLTASWGWHSSRACTTARNSAR